jgi:4-amino-4-deoxy-L-arabinose transferase-like glycosyltransferase
VTRAEAWHAPEERFPKPNDEPYPKIPKKGDKLTQIPYTGPGARSLRVSPNALERISDGQLKPLPYMGLSTTGQFIALNRPEKLNRLENNSNNQASRIATALVPTGAAPPLGMRNTRLNKLLAILSRRPWPLLTVLILQILLSGRLIWSNTAFPDEALYLWAGHLEWAHWLHGQSIPAFATFFSGAPVVYPPVGAVADAIGGLAGARLLSLFFMLIATTMVHGVTRRLFGRLAAVFAAGLFVSMAAVQYLGAFATYDAMALMLLAIATWLGVRAAFASPGWGVMLVILSTAVLSLAGAAKYAAMIFAPVVVLVAVSVAWWRNGLRAGIRTALIMAVSATAILSAAVYSGGHSYWQGISYTTLARAQGTAARSFLIYECVQWEGALLLLAFFGTAALFVTVRKEHRAVRKEHRAVILLGCVLVGAMLLVPIEQIRIQTDVSLFKHIGYGAWFGAIIAGYGLASFRRAVARQKETYAIAISFAAAIIVGIPSIPWAKSHFGWPNTMNVIPAVARALKTTSGPVLADDRGNIVDYYLPDLVLNREISGTFYFAFNDPTSGLHLTQKTAYAAAINNRYFSMIFLEFWDATTADDWVQSDIKRYGGYKLVAKIPYSATGKHGDAMIWIRQRGTR